MKVITTINDQTYEVDIEVDPNRENWFMARLGDREIKLELTERKPGSMTVSVGGKVGFYEFRTDRGRIIETVYRNRSFKTALKNPQQEVLEQLLEEFGAGLGGTASETVLKAPMPGKILGIQVKVGEKIQLGQVVCVLEAMKMENEISSTIEGKISKVYVGVGDSVMAEAPLLEVEPPD